MEPITREFMLKVSEVAIKHNVKAAFLIRSAACIVIHESDVVEAKVERIQELFRDKSFNDLSKNLDELSKSLDELLKISDDITGDITGDEK